MSGGRIRGAMVAGLRLQSVQWSAVESMLGIDSNICNVLFCRGTKTCVKKVPVQLSQDVEGLGRAGDIKQVASGYARNYLVPEKLARPVAVVGKGSYRGLQLAASQSQSSPNLQLNTIANNNNNNNDSDVLLATLEGTKSNVYAEEEEEALVKKEAKMRRKIETIVSKLTESTVSFKVKAGSDGILEDPIGPQALASAVGKQLGIEIVPQLVDMDPGDVLETSGDFLIPLNLIKSDGTKASLQVRIQAT